MANTELTASDGFKIGAYVAQPSGKAKGGVVVIQEIFGVNRHIRAVADGYAAAGYVAIAPQIFDRVERNVELGYTAQPDFDKGLRIAFQDLKLSDTLLDLQAAIDHVAGFGRVGVVGYCFGGLLTWLSACSLERVAAASAYYGGGIVKHVERSARCPVMMHFGALDKHIPLSEVDTIRAAHAEVQVFVYDADHGFNCDERASYNETSCVLARQRTLDFFATQLG
jgi:carboxymethylenebutenolidase